MTINASKIFEQKFPGLAAQHKLKPFQEKVIYHLINNGSTVAVMPTGGGKSWIYWVSAQALGGTCLVVSPLIALIDEQAEKLKNEGFDILAIHSGVGASEQMRTLKDFANNSRNPDFIFVSPERMATDGFFEYCINLRNNQIKLLVIDEIHCVSQWGFDFRPFYKRIPCFLNDVFGEQWPPILGLTATINPKELNDICNDFNIQRKSIIKDETLLRLGIDLHVEKFDAEEEKEERFWNLISNHTDEKILVYLYRKYHKRGVEDLCKKAIDRGINAVFFHGDMSGGDRQEVLKEFKAGNKNIVFATNAFGMGIDIPDIRVVIHFMLPESIEQYYQEIGRAGRDDKGATAYMLFTNKNIQIRKTHFIDKSFPIGDEIKELFKTATNNETGKKTLQYFSEEGLQSALPYFLNCGAITIKGKGFTNLKVFKKNNKQLQDIIDSTRTGIVIPVLMKPEFSELSCKQFFNVFYEAIVSGQAILERNLDKCFLIEVKENELTKAQIKDIEDESNFKKEYKHSLLDYFVYLLNNFDNSTSLHQEIGKYLGINKHLLGKIYITESNDSVRSKSEVIIANILFRSNIPFKYEKRLYYGTDKWKEPDFTIEYNGKIWYWEHLGLLGDEDYNNDWLEKKEIYKKMGIIDRVIITKESAILSKIANEKINTILNSMDCTP